MSYKSVNDLPSEEKCRMGLRAKYRVRPATKGTRPKTSGNSGKCGRKYRSHMRGHGGGQVCAEEKARRDAQMREAQVARSLWGSQ